MTDAELHAELSETWRKPRGLFLSEGEPSR